MFTSLMPFGRSRLLDGRGVLVGELDGRDAVCAVQVHAAGQAHVLQAERGRLVDALEDGELAERVGMDGHLPAKLVGGAGRLGGVLRQHSRFPPRPLRSIIVSFLIIVCP